MTKEESETLLARYSVQPRIVDNRPRGWNYLDVDILLDGERIGSYQRNYPNLYDTFLPFVQQDANGNIQVFALYSPHYTATRLMRLPECQDIGGEQPDGRGFCPTGFYVPFSPDRELTGRLGFVSGCLWGDDSSWKIQYLDLSEAANGILRRDDRFGYMEIPRAVTLQNAVNMKHFYNQDEEGRIEFTAVRTFFLRQNRFAEPFE